MKSYRLRFHGFSFAEMHQEVADASKRASFSPGCRIPAFIDCGTSSLIAMKRSGVDASRIGSIISAACRWPFGGVPFLILNGVGAPQARPLVIAGPPGVRDRVESAMEVLFPGSSRVSRRFVVEFVELGDRVANTIGPATVTPFLVEHACGAPPYALRIEYGGKVIAYSGDTENKDSISSTPLSRRIIFRVRNVFLTNKIKYHLDYRTLLTNHNNWGAGDWYSHT